MSLKVLTQVWEHGPSSQGELLVMLALADFSDDAGISWPSVETIATKARMSDRNARRILRKLEADGLIKTSATKGGRKGTNEYHIVPVNSKNPDNLSPGQMEHETRTNGTETRTDDALNPDIAMSAEPYEPSGTVKEPSVTDILCSVLREETAVDFIAHRKAMKKPVTVVAAKRLIKAVEGHPNPDAVFDASIANGWQGVFPERSVNGQPSKQSKNGAAIDAAKRAGERWEARRMDRG